MFGRRVWRSKNRFQRKFLGLIAGLAFVAAVDNGVAQEKEQQGSGVQWIWNKTATQRQPLLNETTYFRKKVHLNAPVQGWLALTADDYFEVYINGSRLAVGESGGRLKTHEVTRLLKEGENLIAVQVTNQKGSSAGLAAQLVVQEKQGQTVLVNTDNSWRASTNPLPLWNLAVYSDRFWGEAHPLGELKIRKAEESVTAQVSEKEEVTAVSMRDQKGAATHSTAGEQEAAKQIIAATDVTDPSGLTTVSSESQFQLSREFQIEELAREEELGSVIAMTFNESGDIIASQEGGGLILIYDSNNDQRPDKARPLSQEVHTCQGILVIDRSIFVTGIGPQGAGLYKLSDNNQDGNYETARTILEFGAEQPSEHGAHGLCLGPDGLIYLVSGNEIVLPQEYAESSPLKYIYEGDLIQPRYEDPSGHAVGVKVPGGTIIRTDQDGTFVELVAGGLRNAYDIAFDRHGELFVHDSDMESDMGMTWYRPTRLYHVTPGADFGWRSGWAKLPEYYHDTLTGIADTGRGSPTGAVVYNHKMFPFRYHNALFSADWSEGRILVARLKKEGSSYTTVVETFLTGQPLNVTDLEVGPDGALYFTTGGRGTAGGLYRVRWRGEVPPEVLQFGQGLTRAFRLPQLESAWTRSEITEIRRKHGAEWEKTLRLVATNVKNHVNFRIRALRLMQMFPGKVDTEMMGALTVDPNEQIRAAACYLLGLDDQETTKGLLITKLEDTSSLVRRRACEALRRRGEIVPLEKMVTTLVSTDRTEQYAARLLLQQQPIENWEEELLQQDHHRLFIQGATASLIAAPKKEFAKRVLQRFRYFLDEAISDPDFLDMLRLVEIAIIQGELSPQETIRLRESIIEEYPSMHRQMNRELVRILAYVQSEEAADRFWEELENEHIADVDRLHIAIHLGYLKKGWTPEKKIALLKYLETASTAGGGESYVHYLRAITRDVAGTLTEAEQLDVLQSGEEIPTAALGVLYQLPVFLQPEIFEALKKLDTNLAEDTSKASEALKVGIVAVLARSGEDKAMQYLRDVWLLQPARRQTVAMGLAQKPEGDNWSYLLNSLPELKGAAAEEVSRQLLTVDQKPKDIKHYQNVLDLAKRQNLTEAEETLKLLTLWTEKQVPFQHTAPETTFGQWQNWIVENQRHFQLQENFPKQEVTTEKAITSEVSLDPKEIKLPKESSIGTVTSENRGRPTWSYEAADEVIGQFAGEVGYAEGIAVFQKAQCASCHQFGAIGAAIGPDLTTAHKTFQRSEILEAIFEPSKEISSQYASKTIVTTSGRAYSGLVSSSPTGDSVIVTLSTGEEKRIVTDEVDEIFDSKKSVMPDNLLAGLTDREVASLLLLFETPPAKIGMKRRKLVLPKVEVIDLGVQEATLPDKLHEQKQKNTIRLGDLKKRIR
ncbi:MAG: c-type cytochrome [Pirellulaceae bacterium]|nr:c-type cytochrome [Pirellulaceae bacterium]